MSEAVERLSEVQRQRFAVYEATVEAGFVSQNAQILALVQIRDERLYRGEYGTFDAYCEKRWGRSASRINQLIQAAKVIENLHNGFDQHAGQIEEIQADNDQHVGQAVLPNVRQATELAKLDNPEEQREVWQEVVESGEPVTAKTVAVAVEAAQVEKQYEQFAVSGWSAKEVVKAKALLDAMLEEDRDVAVTLVGAVGWPSDRVMTALQTLVGMEAERRAETLRLYRSRDTREQAKAIARMVRQRPAGDPRRRTLEVWLADVEHAARMFPDDPISESIRELVKQTKAVIAAIKQQEEADSDGTEAP